MNGDRTGTQASFKYEPGSLHKALQIMKGRNIVHSQLDVNEGKANRLGRGRLPDP
jgi:hypothetical protein